MNKILKRIMIAVISFLAVMAVLIGVLMGVSGIFEKPLYLEPWEKTYSEQFEDPRVRLSAHGLLAANGHNMQPWKIVLDTDPAVFYLYADASRLTDSVDPDARQMMISQGTFLEYVRVAGAERGYEVFFELFPMGQYDEKNLTESMDEKPVAKITVTKSAANESALYDAIFLPDTNRSPYLPQKLSTEQCGKLMSLGQPDISLSVFQDEENLSKLSGLALRASAVEAGVEAAAKETEEIFRPNEYDKNKHRYGFSVEGQGTKGFMKHILQGLVTLFPSMNSGKAAADRLIDSTRAAVDNTPAYALIVSDGNSRESQVKSGMMYGRLVLKAHGMGFAAQPLSQAIEEYPKMAEIYREIHDEYAGGGTIQMLVRLGKPATDAPNSMRRDVLDLVRDDANE